MYKNQKPIVILSGQDMTGGPELLHQFANELNTIGREAYICYSPSGKHEVDTPSPYLKYDAPKISAADIDDAIVVVPEPATRHIKRFPNSKIVIWWLSVDNYFGLTRKSHLHDGVQRVRTLFQGRVPITRLKAFDHFVQSEYAADFLKRRGIPSRMLTDYLSEEHFSKAPSTDRADRILFNPKKGLERTTRLKSLMPQYEFVPLIGFKTQELVRLFQTSKVYIDFGHHPGKDRMPREAAMGGCCIVTNRRGSAGFFQDVPIDDRYKLDDKRSDFDSEAVRIIADIMERFSTHERNFLEYRDKISAERSVFSKQVREHFEP